MKSLTTSAKMLVAAAAVASAGLGFAPTPAVAQDVEITPETVSTRIDIAGRQRMLSQRMAKFLCFARSGVDVLENVEGLTSSKDLYERSHKGIAFGDADMGLFAEGDDSVNRVWRDVDLMWTSLNSVYDAALSGQEVTEEDFDRAMRLTGEVMSRNNDMVAQLRAAYASEIGSGGMGAAVLIDLYGRQRMLSQKLEKEVCLVARGYDLDATRPELEETLKLFETSIQAFIEGLPIAGIPEAPSPEIKEELQIAYDHWVPVRGTAVSVAEGRAVTLTELSDFWHAIDEFLVDMNKAVGLLIEHQRADS